MLSAVVFCIGLFGVITRRNAIGLLLGIELMLNAVNINLVAFSRFSGSVSGMVFTVFTICITVAEAALGLAIVILLFRIRRTVMADQLDLLKG
jgi:NADH-quinone oxidoreductase subunit K